MLGVSVTGIKTTVVGSEHVNLGKKHGNCQNIHCSKKIFEQLMSFIHFTFL